MIIEFKATKGHNFLKMILLFFLFMLFENHLFQTELVIRVLTMNRPKALTALLDSINQAEYYGKTVNLEIIVDKGKDDDYESVCNLAKSFNWTFGSKNLTISKKSLGINRMWIQPFVENVPHLILEDDVVVSKYYFSHFLDFMKFYENQTNLKKHIGGVGMHHLRHVSITSKYRIGDWEVIRKLVPNNYTFFAEHTDTWAPIFLPEFWDEYIAADKKNPKKTDICIPKFVDNCWHVTMDEVYAEALLHYVAYVKNFFFMYYNHDSSLERIAHNLKVKGAHFPANSYDAPNKMERSKIHFNYSTDYFFDGSLTPKNISDKNQLNSEEKLKQIPVKQRCSC